MSKKSVEVSVTKNASLEPDNTIIAAIDLGSNSFHMVVAQVRDGQPVVIDRLKEMVRLGAGLDENNRLSREARERAFDCLARFGERVRHLPAGNVRVVGTNTLRMAKKSASFRREAEHLLGHEIEIIAGVEEARLIYRGVARTLSADDRRRLVVDIGGGSTELIIGSGLQPLLMESVSLGCISMTRAVFADGVINREHIDAAALLVAQRVGPHITKYRRLGWDLCVGASGTARSAAEVINAERGAADALSRADLEQLINQVVAMGHIDKLTFDGLSSDRREVFMGGTAVLLGLFRALDIDRMDIAPGALREGVLDELCGRLAEDDIRERSVRSLMQRFNVDVAHAERVASTAEALLDSVERRWALQDNSYRRRLRWAASLHELGLDIAHSRYHRHSAYIFANADLAGFSQQEQELIAALLRLHRRSFDTDAHLASITRERRLETARLAALLRLAVLLCRNRSDEPVPIKSLRAGRKSLNVTFDEGWLSDKPLSEADLAAEAELLQKAGWQLGFA